MDSAMEVDNPINSRGTKRTASEAGLASQPPRRIRVNNLTEWTYTTNDVLFRGKIYS